MSHELRRPWIDEDPERLPDGQICVTHLSHDKGVLMLRGHVIKADGKRGAVRIFQMRACHAASMLRVMALGYDSGRGMFHPADYDNPWKELNDYIERRRAG